MALLKRSLIALFVTCLSASADPVKLKQQTLNIISPTKNVQQQVADEAKPDVVPIYMYSRENSLDGDYKFRYETGNGIFAEERGVVLNKGTEDEANSVVGSYRYVSPEGVPIEVTYTAGVDGFRAYGAHLPVAPPAAVLPKNLAYKNVAQGPFARPQFRAVADDSDLPAAEVRTIDDNDDDQQATSQSVRNSAGSTQSSRSGLPAAQAEAEAAANELPEKPVILLVGGDEQSTVNKPLSQSPTAANEVEQPQKVDSFFDVKKPLAAEYYQQFSAPTPTTSWDQLVRNTQPSQDQSVFSPSATTPPAQLQLQQQQQQQQQQPQQQPQQQQQQQPQQLPQPQQQPQQQLQQQQLQLLQQQQQQQQKLSTVENFESPKPVVSVVPVLQTIPQAVQTQPKVVPVLQRVVPGGGYQQYQQQQQQQYQRQPYQQQPYQQKPYQQQPYQQQSYQQQQQPYQQQKPYQQPRFNAMPFPPAFGQHPRPAESLRQFSVEPQQMWYVPQNQQHTRYFQMPSVPRTMELPKY